MPTRRTVLSGAAATAVAPSITRAQSASTLKFVPAADLSSLDPVWTTSYQSRDHGFMVFDTLFGLTEDFRAEPQTAEGAVSDDQGKTWRITLRDGLLFHDGSKVLARDAVASIRRWGARDGFGQALLAATDELAAPDDKTIQFRLKAPFPLLPDALAKTPPSMCPIMPQRLAETDPKRQLTEMVGSGPFRFKPDERIAGAEVIYERNTVYVPRGSGTPSGTAGPKIAHFDRVEWRIIQDPATASAALQRGEVDWWLTVDFGFGAEPDAGPAVAGGDHGADRLHRDHAVQPADPAVQQPGDAARDPGRRAAIRLHDRHGWHRPGQLARQMRLFLPRHADGERCRPRRSHQSA